MKLPKVEEYSACDIHSLLFNAFSAGFSKGQLSKDVKSTTELIELAEAYAGRIAQHDCTPLSQNVGGTADSDDSLTDGE